MTKEFGKGFTVTNLKNMRQFYLIFQKGHILNDQLSWTHYRLLMRVENEILEKVKLSNYSVRKSLEILIKKA